MSSTPPGGRYSHDNSTGIDIPRNPWPGFYFTTMLCQSTEVKLNSQLTYTAQKSCESCRGPTGLKASSVRRDPEIPRGSRSRVPGLYRTFPLSQNLHI